MPNIIKPTQRPPRLAPLLLFQAFVSSSSSTRSGFCVCRFRLRLFLLSLFLRLIHRLIRPFIAISSVFFFVLVFDRLHLFITVPRRLHIFRLGPALPSPILHRLRIFCFRPGLPWVIIIIVVVVVVVVVIIIIMNQCRFASPHKHSYLPPLLLLRHSR